MRVVWTWKRSAFAGEQYKRGDEIPWRTWLDNTNYRQRKQLVDLGYVEILPSDDEREVK